MRSSRRKRPASSRDDSTDALLPAGEFGPSLNKLRVCSDVSAPPGQKWLKLTFPHDVMLRPLHSKIGCGIPPQLIDCDGDSIVPRRRSASLPASGGAGRNFELHVRCCNSSSVGQCGKQLWSASLLLAEYLWCIRHSLSASAVLELGAGLAVPSLCISAFSRQVFISDSNKVSRRFPRAALQPFCLIMRYRRRWKLPFRPTLAPAAAATAPSCCWTGGGRSLPLS
jgi:hypothetical protein